MNQFFELVAANQALLLLVSLTLNVLLLIVFLIGTVSNGKVRSQYRTLMKGVKQENLEKLLLKQTEIIHQSLDQVNQLSMRTSKLETIIEKCLQKTSIIRFNAYDNMGSDLSFSLALLDAKDNGLVVSSLYGREESRTYAKPIVKGISSYPLSEEEEDAIKRARS